MGLCPSDSINPVASVPMGIDGRLPMWKDVLNRDYEPWDSILMVIDTSRHTVDESIQKTIGYSKLRA